MTLVRKQIHFQIVSICGKCHRPKWRTNNKDVLVKTTCRSAAGLTAAHYMAFSHRFWWCVTRRDKWRKTVQALMSQMRGFGKIHIIKDGLRLLNHTNWAVSSDCRTDFHNRPTATFIGHTPGISHMMLADYPALQKMSSCLLFSKT